MAVQFSNVQVVESVDSKSLPAVMLRMWLGDLDQNSLSVLIGADFSVPADFLFLAFSAMGMNRPFSWKLRISG